MGVAGTYFHVQTNTALAEKYNLARLPDSHIQE